jgi:EAL domain-containing protein (putative c-di-GMP-specific phosphodiesterase class I)
MAMYHAKSLGRANFQFYHRGLNARALERLTLENDLRRALEQDQLSLYFQPQLDLRTGQVVGAEALLRWHHPERGLIPPDDFIALAEESGLILSIGQWVLRAGCSEACAWRRSGLGDLRVAINISSLQWQRPDFVAETVAVLRETGLPPALLELEVTESTAMAYAEATATTLQRLRALGMAVAIDDFGTGYSSLNYLKSFPLDRLKIDRSFIKDIGAEDGNAAIVTAIIAMAHQLQIEVVAEGVETEAQLAFLRAHDCDQIQGHLLGKPLPAAQFLDWLVTWPGSAPGSAPASAGVRESA